MNRHKITLFLLPVMMLSLWCSMTTASTRTFTDDDIEEVDIDTIEAEEQYVPLTMQQYIDSLITARHTYKVTRTTYVRQRKGRRRKAVKQTVTKTRSYTATCCIYDITADTLVYEYEADRMMKPASTQKLYTAAAMLVNHGDSFAFETLVSTDGEEAMDSLGNIFLKGDIFIKTSCDPTLTHDDAITIKDEIEAMGYDSINGSIVLCHNPKTERMKLAEDKFAQSVAKLLKADTIRFSSGVIWSDMTTTKEGNRIISKLSTPLEKVLYKMLKNSNNTYAEAMLLNLRENNEDWTYDTCKAVVRDMVREIWQRYRPDSVLNDCHATYYNIEDGSGLSHSNKTTARGQVELLRYIHSNPKVYSVIYDHLPVAGVDGTLSRRMTSGAAYKNVHAKTGTLNRVATLSGYTTAANGNLLAFSILINECDDKPFARKLQDKICQEISNYGHESTEQTQGPKIPNTQTTPNN